MAEGPVATNITLSMRVLLTGPAGDRGQHYVRRVLSLSLPTGGRPCGQIDIIVGEATEYTVTCLVQQATARFIDPCGNSGCGIPMYADLELHLTPLRGIEETKKNNFFGTLGE